MARDTSESFGDTNFGQLPLLGYYEQRRRYPRVDVSLPAILTTNDHRVLKAWVRNVSTDGLQVRCDPETARALHPQATQIAPGRQPGVLLRFDLPLERGDCTIATRGRICYMAARSKDQIAFGVQFMELGLDAKQALTTFITESLRPRE